MTRAYRFRNRHLHRQWLAAVKASAPMKPQESGVAACVIEGMSNRDIGAAVGLSEKSIEQWVAKLNQRYGTGGNRVLLALKLWEDRA